MSFLNKIKGWGQDRGASSESTQDATQQDGSFDDAFARHDAMARDTAGTMPLEVPTLQQTGSIDSSIITEAAHIGRAHV
jgi:hypothetical protein